MANGPSNATDVKWWHVVGIPDGAYRMWDSHLKAEEPDPPAPYLYQAPTLGETPAYDLDCADIGQPIIISGSDLHGLDRDNDGIGCEGW